MDARDVYREALRARYAWFEDNPEGNPGTIHLPEGHARVLMQDVLDRILDDEERAAVAARGLAVVYDGGRLFGMEVARSHDGEVRVTA